MEHWLYAGPLSVLLADGHLLYVRHGEVELLRRIYLAVRDARWGMVPARIHRQEIEQGEAGFRVGFLVTQEAGPLCLQWRVRIVARAEGDAVELRYAIEGQAETAFSANRIGLCVLHAADGHAGREVEVESPAGTRAVGRFPELVAPAPVFTDVTVLRAQHDGLRTELRCDGDVFETEDQRNWGDDSFKTYSRPSALPIPFEVAAGERFAQQVTLAARADGEGRARGPWRDSAEVTLTLGAGPGVELPRLGLALPSELTAHTGRERQRLELLRPAYLRVDVVPMRAASVERLSGAVEEGRRFGLPLELGLWLSRAPQRELTRLVETLDTFTPKLVGAILYSLHEQVVPPDVFRAARRVLGHSIPEVPVGLGSSSYFEGLNQARELAGQVRLLAAPTAPATHLRDDHTLAENLTVPLSLARTVAAFAPGAALSLGRIDLRPQPGPGTGPFRVVARDGRQAEDLADHVDPRQGSLLCAAWTVGHLACVAASGVARATYFETTGPLGVIPAERGPALPASFAPAEAKVFPVYHVLADVAELPGARALPVQSSAPLDVVALALHAAPARLRLLVANLGRMPRGVHLPVALRGLRLSRLGREQVLAAMVEPERYRARAVETQEEGPVVVGPHEVVRIDGELAGRAI